MPQFTHADRNMIEAEMCVWNAAEVLSNIEQSGEFRNRIQACRSDLEKIAREMREYNDQFEEEDDESTPARTPVGKRHD
jgi:hypothetical protein